MTRLLSLFVLAALANGAVAAEPIAPAPFTVGPFAEKFVRPISGGDRPDPIAYSYGPRRFRSDQRYDFNRGLDLQVDKGTPVRVVLAGEVRITGMNPGYKQPVVQLRHRKPDSAPGTGGNAGAKYFYTIHGRRRRADSPHLRRDPVEPPLFAEGQVVRPARHVGIERSGIEPGL